MRSKIISEKYNSDVRFADSHQELKAKFENICKIAENIALDEFKKTRFQYGCYYHIDRIKARGLMIMLFPSDSILVRDYTGDTATVLITWDKIDEILKRKDNTGINITVEPHLQNGKQKYVINNTISLEEAIKFTS